MRVVGGMFFFQLCGLRVCLLFACAHARGECLRERASGVTERRNESYTEPSNSRTTDNFATERAMLQHKMPIEDLFSLFIEFIASVIRFGIIALHTHMSSSVEK